MLGDDLSGSMLSGFVGKEDALQLFVPLGISLEDFFMEFLAFQEGLLCCSVESLHLTICPGMIGAGNVVSDICELIEHVSNLRIQQEKKNQKYIKVN